MGSDANFRIILHLCEILKYPMAEFGIASSAYPIFEIMKNPYPREDFLIKNCLLQELRCQKCLYMGETKVLNSVSTY